VPEWPVYPLKTRWGHRIRPMRTARGHRCCSRPGAYGIAGGRGALHGASTSWRAPSIGRHDLRAPSGAIAFSRGGPDLAVVRCTSEPGEARGTTRARLGRGQSAW